MRSAAKNPYATCHEIAVRGGVECPGERPAVGRLIDPSTDTPYPACAWHMNRWSRRAVFLPIEATADLRHVSQ